MPIDIGANTFFIYVDPNSQRQSTIKLDRNSIATDNSLLPTQSFSNTTFYSISDNIQTTILPKVNPKTYPLSIIIIRKSDANYIYKRTYQKLLDAVSYIGGIFQSILALFFFVQIFNTSYFQMKFATKYFKCKEAKDFHVVKFIKQTVYDLLHQTRFQPQWKETESRRKISEAVVNLQDIVYINRRIDFLQKSTSVLFQKHQLKGLRLLHNKTDSEVLRDYKKQKFRDQFIFFLKKHQKNDSQQPQHQRQINNDPLVLEDGGIGSKQMTLDVGDNKNQQKQKREIKIGSQFNLDKKISGILVEPKAQGFHSSENILRLSQLRHSHQVNPQNKKKVIFDEIQGEELQEFDNSENDNLLIEDIEGDLKRFVREAQKPTGDKRSKRIYEELQSEMREMLKAAIVQFEGKQVNKVQHPISEAFELDLVIH